MNGSISLDNFEITDNRIMDVLEVAKNLKSEYTVIPRLLFQKTPSSSILGVSYDAIVSVINAQCLDDPKYYELWKDESLPYIRLESKNINQFNLEHKTIMKSLHRDYDPVKEARLLYNTYLVNGKPTSVGTRLDDRDVELESKGILLPTMPLFNHTESLGKAESMLFAYQNSSFAVQSTEITDNQAFMDIANSKAGIGATMWVPEGVGNLTTEQAHRYTMSLTGNLLNISKGDKVFITIKDRLAGRTGYNFIVRFDVYKIKKGMTISYYMMMLKVV
jgi:hypothetical protein